MRQGSARPEVPSRIAVRAGTATLSAPKIRLPCRRLRRPDSRLLQRATSDPFDISMTVTQLGSQRRLGDIELSASQCGAAEARRRTASGKGLFRTTFLTDQMFHR